MYRHPATPSPLISSNIDGLRINPRGRTGGFLAADGPGPRGPLPTGGRLASRAVRRVDDVNLAARIVDAAAGGEILVSEAVREALDGARAFALAPAPPLELRGITGRHAAYSVEWNGTPPREHLG